RWPSSCSSIASSAHRAVRWGTTASAAGVSCSMTFLRVRSTTAGFQHLLLDRGEDRSVRLVHREHVSVLADGIATKGMVRAGVHGLLARAGWAAVDDQARPQDIAGPRSA